MAARQRQLPLVPPLNFAMVMPGVYRSGYPNGRNHSFLRSLGVRTVVMCAAEEYESNKFGRLNMDFFHESGMSVVRCAMNANKEPFGGVDEAVVAKALEIILDARNHPVLVHDDRGRHRCGVIVACLRKVQGWSLAAIVAEYTLFAQDTARPLDAQAIELFSHPVYVDPAHVPRWLDVECVPSSSLAR